MDGKGGADWAPAAAREAARVLGGRAEEVRRLRRSLAGLEELPWRSPAAAAFRHRLGEHLGAVERLAGACEGAAALLRAHADAVEDAAAALAAGPLRSAGGPR